MTILKIPNQSQEKWPWVFEQDTNWKIFDYYLEQKVQDIAKAFDEVGIQYSIKPTRHYHKIVFATPDDEHMAIMHFGEYK